MNATLKQAQRNERNLKVLPSGYGIGKYPATTGA